MRKQQQEIITGMIVDDHVTITLHELCVRSGVPEEFIQEMVDQGLLEPRGKTPKNWQFSMTATRRLRTVVRLQKDLEINLAGIALILDLLDEMDELRSRLHLLERLR